MSKKLTAIFLFLVLLASACATKTPSTQLSATLNPETPVPTNLPDCTNSAGFVADVTIPDNSSISAGASFTKTWRVKNTGTCIWGPKYTLTHYSEETMSATASVPLSVTFPNQVVDVSMKLTAPNTAGNHTGYFVIKNPAGLIMKIDDDSRLSVVIDVSGSAAGGSIAAQGSGSIPATSSSAGSGLVNVTCAYTPDAAKVAETISALNAYRSQNGLPAYTVNEQLSMAATAHANDMACNNLFVHQGSDGSTPATRVAASGYAASSVIENVYGSYPPLSGQGAVDWWKNDKTDIRHNQNLLSTKYTEIGVGYSFYNNFGYYVIDFAKP